MPYGLGRTDLYIILYQSESDEVDWITQQFLKPGEEIAQHILTSNDLVELLLLTTSILLVVEQRFDAVHAGIDHIFMLLALLHNTDILIAQLV